MIKRRTIGLTVATAVLGGVGIYGATAVFAAVPPTEYRPATTQSSDTGPGARAGQDRDEMIRHCTEHLPASEREKARQHMEETMSERMSGGSTEHRHHDEDRHEGMR
ncbi:hypothetical protein [Streptomyces wuyuanensis]|uniref:Uncharacterized protein n=1 Tax=Streptomyces wuyuanensis TaxID=1196353 RepID=A0A1H0B8E6_9ACTN|nr:hypothetical protein [Streptomyces wuyuanensis]SDN41930.1 hypothetical protein SAMN05444921_126109 [Streptomyces wuyuanensis]